MNDKLNAAAKRFLEDNGYSAWTQSTNAKFFLEVLAKLIAQKASQDVLLHIMNKASNASAFRQGLLRAGIIKATEGERTSAGADMLADLDI